MPTGGRVRAGERPTTVKNLSILANQLSYNPLKQLTQMRDWLGTTEVEMDSQGRVTQVTDFEGKTVAYGWDGEGRRERLTYPDGSEVRYGYDTLGRLASVGTAEGETRYGYDALGRMRERELPNGVRTEYGLDALGHLESLTHRRGGEVLDAFRYSYDPAGNITSIDKERAGMPEDSGLFTYEYDALNRLTAAERAGERKEYQYDSVGNRIAELLSGQTVRHSYNGRNQLIRSEDGGEATDYRYDHRGNLREVLRGGVLEASYAFDATNMLAKAYSVERGEAEYAYDGLRNRVKRLERLAGGDMLRSEAQAGIDPCAEMRYVLDMTRPYDNLLMTQGGMSEVKGEDTKKYIWGNELLAAEGEDSYYFLQDHLHSPIRLIDGKGARDDETCAYDEFGVRKVGAGADRNPQEKHHGMSCRNPFGFTGYQPDEASGLYYAQARYYDPANARMVAEDAIRSGQNWYAYCGGNPVRFVDPMGLDAQQAIQSALDNARNEGLQQSTYQIPATDMRNAMEYAEFYNPITSPWRRDEINTDRMQRDGTKAAFPIASVDDVTRAVETGKINKDASRVQSFKNDINAGMVYDPATLGYGYGNRCVAYGGAIMDQLGIPAYANNPGASKRRSYTNPAFNALEVDPSVLMIVEIGRSNGELVDRQLKINGMPVEGSEDWSPELQNNYFLLDRGLSRFSAIFTNDISHMMFGGSGYSFFSVTNDRLFDNLFMHLKKEEVEGIIYVVFNVDVEGYHALICDGG